MAYDPSVYEAQSRAAVQNYGSNMAMQAYSRFLAEQTAGRQQESLTKQYTRALPQVMSGYGRRNLAGPRIASGIQRAGLGEFAMQKASDFGELARSFQEQQRQYELQSNQLTSALNQQLADIEAEKARQIALDAQIILRQRAGGY